MYETQPKISIIITVLNGADTLKQTLISIENQTYANYELVIVDGGSSDKTVEIIRESTISNKILKIVPGIGLYAGLNTGVSLATGDWFYFMGADDKLHKADTLHAVANTIARRKASTKVIVGFVNCVKQKYILRPLFGSPYLLRYQAHHQGIFYDKNIFATLIYNEHMRIASDYEFNLILALTGIPHEKMDIIVCDFGGDGISENQMKQGYIEMQQVHGRLFNGVTRHWVKSYFWLRRSVGTFLRQYELISISKNLKRLFG